MKLVEGTLCAALSLKYPRLRMKVFILDDGNRVEIKDMVIRVQRQAVTLNVCDNIEYIARTKSANVPHNAKAGNINNALLCEGLRGEFLVVYDSDMVCKPDFLLKTLGHFLKMKKLDSTAKYEFFSLKSRTAFVQVPQDFYNVPWFDPFGHAARFFYGPMMQGRDGMSATPCVGTGVIFQRQALLSIGGQSYGSVTEDYLTCMQLQHAGNN